MNHTCITNTRNLIYGDSLEVSNLNKIKYSFDQLGLMFDGWKADVIRCEPQCQSRQGRPSPPTTSLHCCIGWYLKINISKPFLIFVLNQIWFVSHNQFGEIHMMTHVREHYSKYFQPTSQEYCFSNVFRGARQEKLKERWFFDCSCFRCQDPTDCGEPCLILQLNNFLFDKTKNKNGVQ